MKAISIRLFSQMIIIKLLTYFLAVWSTAELRLKNQRAKYIENEKTQNETSKEHTRLRRRKRGVIIYADKRTGTNNKAGGDFAANEAHLQYTEPGPFKGRLRQRN